LNSVSHRKQFPPFSLTPEEAGLPLFRLPPATGMFPAEAGGGEGSTEAEELLSRLAWHSSITFQMVSKSVFFSC
jgi:hypothetical protein